MSWINVGDFLFHAGALLAAGFLAYGGWLAITAPQMGPHNATDERRPSGELLVETRLTPPPGDEVRRGTGVVITGLLFFVSGIFGALALPGAALADDPLERGIKAYHDSKYQDAITQFRLAAEGGNARAQEVLGFMYLHGPNFYGAGMPLDRDQAIHWFGRAARGGREVAQHMLCVLSGQPANTVVNRATCAARTAAISTGVRP